MLEFEAIGPGPFAAMMLADMGADVLLVDRPGGNDLGLGHQRRHEVMLRGRRSVTLDLKSASGAAAALRLAERADAIVEGFRPGVMERLGLGPEPLLARNPKLVYGRMTGWGQEGPLAARAGHDINYIALSGALHAIGRAGEAPVAPLNLVGDFGGGGMLLAFGIACGVIEARSSGRGQVVDAAMVDGAALLATMFSGMLAAGSWREERGANFLDTGAPWYDSYADARRRATSRSARSSRSSTPSCWCASASIRPACRSSTTAPAGRSCASASPTAFAGRSRDEWCAAFEGSDACFAPVLSFTESRRHPHVAARAGHDRARRHRPAGAGAALRPHPGRGDAGRRRSAAKAAPRRWPTGDSTPPRSRISRGSASASRADARAGRKPARAKRCVRSRARAQRKAHSPSRSATTPSSRSFSRWAVSERIAIGCRRGGTSA